MVKVQQLRSLKQKATAIPTAPTRSLEATQTFHGPLTKLRMTTDPVMEKDSYSHWEMMTKIKKPHGNLTTKSQKMKSIIWLKVGDGCLVSTTPTFLRMTVILTKKVILCSVLVIGSQFKSLQDFRTTPKQALVSSLDKNISNALILRFLRFW